MPSNKPGSRLIKAAGGVAWRPGPDGGPEILLVHRKKYDDWSLPKGKIEPGEPLPVTAVREVLEEGGARLALGRRLASVRYNVGGRPKRVHYWAARVLSVDARAVPNAEVDEVAWLPADRAVEKVSYPHDHGVLADFAARPAADRPADPAAPRQGAAQGRLEARRRRPPARRLRPLRREGPGRPARLLRPQLPADQLARGPLHGNPAPACAAHRRPGAGRAVALHPQQVTGTGAADSGTVNRRPDPRGHRLGRAHRDLRAPREHAGPAGGGARRPGRLLRRRAGARRQGTRRHGRPREGSRGRCCPRHLRTAQGLGRDAAHVGLLGTEHRPAPRGTGTGAGTEPGLPEQDMAAPARRPRPHLPGGGPGGSGCARWPAAAHAGGRQRRRPRRRCRRPALPRRHDPGVSATATRPGTPPGGDDRSDAARPALASDAACRRCRRPPARSAC